MVLLATVRHCMLLLQVGRWVGYSVATAFALFSLFRIIMSFKRGITVSQQWEAYWREHPAEREVILQAGAEEHTTQARNLAHVMATMQGDPRQTIVWAQAITGMTVSAQAGGQGLYPRIGALRADMPTIMMPAGAGVPAPYPPAGSSTGGYPPMGQDAAIYPAMPSEPLPGLSATTSSSAAPPGASADGPGLSTRMMQRVQQHQVSPSVVAACGCAVSHDVFVAAQSKAHAGSLSGNMQLCGCCWDRWLCRIYTAVMARFVPGSMNAFVTLQGHVQLFSHFRCSLHDCALTRLRQGMMQVSTTYIGLHMQEDMEKVGIGACVALFGVLISTMW